MQQTSKERKFDILMSELKISGFESRYFGILFSLLGISLPILLAANLGITEKTPFVQGIISIALALYAPMIVASIVLYFSLGEYLFMKKLSVFISATAGIFLILFVLFISIDYGHQIISRNIEFSTGLFIFAYLSSTVIFWFKINTKMNTIFNCKF